MSPSRTVAREAATLATRKLGAAPSTLRNPALMAAARAPLPSSQVPALPGSADVALPSSFQTACEGTNTWSSSYEMRALHSITITQCHDIVVILVRNEGSELDQDNTCNHPGT